MTLDIVLISSREPSGLITREFSGLRYFSSSADAISAVDNLNEVDVLAVEGLPTEQSYGTHHGADLLRSVSGPKRVYIFSAFSPRRLGLNQGVDYDVELRVPYSCGKFIETVSSLCLE